jgi:calcineurin-like phosphoesterase family protein
MKKKYNIWFSADAHFSHFKIIKYSNRPFKTLEEMNTELIQKWNEKVKPNDLVYFLGDFCFKSKNRSGDVIKAQEYLKQLNGNIVFVKGNHDYSTNGIRTKIKSLVLEIDGNEIYCTHKPMDSNNFFKLNLVGHVHNLWKSRLDTKFGMTSVLINVGVDVWDFSPVSLNQILEEYHKYKGL